MIDALKNFLLQNFGLNLGVFICSMLPVLELRGSIPLGAFRQMPWLLNYVISVIGNFIPVPFILLFIEKLIEFMKKTKLFRGFALWLEKKAVKKSVKLENYSFWGLVVLVAIPLPGTGAWTGSMVAALVGMKFPKAMLAVFPGILIAGVIVTLISYGVLGFLSFML